MHDFDSLVRPCCHREPNILANSKCRWPRLAASSIPLAKVENGGFGIRARRSERDRRQGNYRAKLHLVGQAAAQVFKDALVCQDAIGHNGNQMSTWGQPVKVTLHEEDLRIQATWKPPTP